MSFLSRELPDTIEPTAVQIEWEECPCLLCGSDQWVPLLEAPDRSRSAGNWFLVVQCRRCGLCFTNPRPAQQDTAASQSEPSPASERLPTRRRKSSAYRKSMPVHGEGRLLDVGCGSGTFLRRMHLDGWNVMGLDPSPGIVRHLREKFALPALVGSLPHDQLTPGSFDVITMWQSLQLAPWPVETLIEARRLLAPGGKLIVAVPNIDSLAFRWFGQAWNGFDLPRNLVHFAPWTLRLVLKKAGFRKTTLHMIRRERWLRASAQIACRMHPRVPRFLRSLRGKDPFQAGDLVRLAHPPIRLHHGDRKVGTSLRVNLASGGRKPPDYADRGVCRQRRE